MSEKIEFYHWDEYKKSGTGIERKDILQNITLQDFFERYADVFFDQFCEQYIQEEKEYWVGHLYKDTFEGKSFGVFLRKIAQEIMQYSLDNQWWILSNQQLQEFLSIMSDCVNEYAHQNNIDHDFIRRREKQLWREHWHHTPYSYAAVQLFDHLWYSFDPKNEEKVLNPNSMWYALEAFFKHFLVNIFFQRTQESLQTSVEIHELFNFQREFNEYASLFMGIMLESDDGWVSDKYIQWMYTLMKEWYQIYWKEWFQRFINSFNDVGDVYEKTWTIIPKVKLQVITDVKSLFDHYFSDMMPKGSDEITVLMRNIWTKYILLHKDNFYFDAPEEWVVNNEEKKITDIFGHESRLYPWYRELRRKNTKENPVFIQDANIFDDQGNKVRRWDIYVTDTDVSSLKKRYYILDQQDWFFPEKWATLKSNSLHMNPAPKLIGPFTKEEPTKMRIDYIRAKAKWKIENGVRVPNVFLK